jgi:trimethylamine:corrinoid methyltransferase-like protein
MKGKPMNNNPLRASRPPLVTADCLEQVEITAGEILAEIGLAVDNPAIRAKVLATGFRESPAGRILVDRAAYREFIADERKAAGNRFAEGAKPGAPPGTIIKVGVSNYPLFRHDMETGLIAPFTTKEHAEAVKLVDSLSARGLVACSPGYPADVPTEFSPVLAYWNQATYSRDGREAPDPKFSKATPWVMEMAGALGRPIKGLPVYVASPLNLSGESLENVILLKDRLESIHVANMPSPGSTAPVNLGDALAQAAAEVVGAAIIAGKLTGIRATWSFCLFPTDMRDLSMVFGSPENFLFHLVSAEALAFLHGDRWHPSAGNIHTMAKLPGAQACAEKASIMTAGALLGEQWFGSVGTLSLDEVFSAEQLIYDLEIRDHVQKLVDGKQVSIDVNRCLAEINMGIAQGSFAGLDSTLGLFRELYWHPAVFERAFLSGWRNKGEKTAKQNAQALINESMKKPAFHLPDGDQKAIDLILQRARKELA